MSSKSLNEFRKQKLGDSFQTKNNSDNTMSQFIFNLDLLNRHIYINRLEVKDFDSLVFELTKKGAKIFSDILSCDTFLTSGKNIMESNIIETINLSDLLTISEIDTTTDSNSVKPVSIEIDGLNQKNSKRIIPLDETRFINDSLTSLNIAFEGDFIHFNETTLTSLIEKLGGKVVGTSSDFNYMICGKGVNPLEITDSLQKILSERDFIRKISR